MIPASKSMKFHHQFASSLCSQFGVEVTHYNFVVDLSSDVEEPRYVIEHILHFFVWVGRGRAYTRIPWGHTFW